jgi:XTP/dITP diphosphohydrolase
MSLQAIAAASCNRAARLDVSRPLLLVACLPTGWTEWQSLLLQFYSHNHLVTLLDADRGISFGTVALDAVARAIATREVPEAEFTCYLPVAATDTGENLQCLIEVVAQLRSPQGCPWDRAQTPVSLTPYIIEEAYETVAAIRHGSNAEIAEELGDLLLQVVLQAQIFSETATFDLGDVAAGIATKLVRRHPHVFGEEAARTLEVDEVNRRWETLKAEESEDQPLVEKLQSYAIAFPPLLAATKIVRKAANTDVSLTDSKAIAARLQATLTELDRTAKLDPTTAQNQLGQFLFALVQFSHCHNLDALEALEQANRDFVRAVAPSVQLAQPVPD